METYEKEIKVMSKNNSFKSVKVKTSLDSEEFSRQFYLDDIELYESFFLMLLNNQNQTIGWAKISQGGCVGTVVDPKIICKYVSDTLSCGVVMVHNHPSGNKIPSQPDINITKKIQQALSFLDCKVLDHIILTKDSYFSFADEGLI
jgi:DNA repair protein RadC